MTNETKHTQGIAHMVVRELYEGCSDLHQTQLIGEIHRLRQQNAELIRALAFVRDDLNSEIDYETRLIVESALAKVQS